MECTQNRACWCNNHPIVPIDNKSSDCYCPNCLEYEMALKINNSEYVVTPDTAEKIAKLGLKTDNTLIENQDYSYNDDGMMVLSKWYLLRRGYCCDNGCVNCPY